MANNDVQRTLDRILAELKSGDSARCSSAIQELNTLDFSSPAIVRELEKLAAHPPDEELRRRAVQALTTRVHRFVHAKTNKLNSEDRALLLKQIQEWQEDGLLEASTADVIRQRYNFDIGISSAAPQPFDQAPSARISQGRPAPVIEKESAPPAVQQPAVPAGPPPSLLQTLLSEASIKIYLYLGAFFVIASALILAALVEAARLPVLTVATLVFGGSAIALRRRLPQPSFALFIVFSFLLPIDANVLVERTGLSDPALSTYWTILFLIMAGIWGFSVWFYESRFFSAVAFVSLSLAFYRAGNIFSAEAESQIFLGMLASLVGLAGTWVLRKWKDDKFSSFVFWLAQLQVLGLLFISLITATVHVFVSDIFNAWWILIALTWLAAAFFYVLSDLLTPTFFFPWMAVAALLPLPWFFLETFTVTQPAYVLGFWVWGTVLALTSEAVFQLSFDKIKKYHWALLTGSISLFLTAVVIALDWDKPGLTFAILALTALVYTALHLLRPRWYVWSVALLSGLFAYFMFFQLPIIERLEVPFVYQFLIASILLVLPELFAGSPLSLKSETRWPAITLGIFVSIFGMTLALADLDHTGRGALALIIYAVLFTLHALHSKQEWLGYFAAATESLALIYVLDDLNLDLRLPALTLLSALYYATGFFFRRRADEMKAWGNVLINSALTLGVLLSLTSLALSKETSGWYVILIALLFLVETFARPLLWLELAVETLLSFALYLILGDFHVTYIGHFLFGASLIWLGGDLIFSRLNQGRRIHRSITLGAGYFLAFISTFALWDVSNPITPTIYYSLYAVFFALYAYLQDEPRLGYLATVPLPLALIKFCDTLNFEKWIFLLIALAVLYYLSGYWLRRNQKAEGWHEMLLYSGLGLGVLTSFAAPFQGGLDASIPVAIAATLFAAEGFARRNVWWALPANALYLMSYFMILAELNVDEPQYYSIGAALLGMLMHYLLTSAGSKTGAFITGMLSQLVLLGTTYIQMFSTEKLSFFFVLFVQSLVVLAYGLIQRSRSLVITPIAFAVLGVITVVYSALKGLGPVILIGSTGILLLMAGIAAVLMRERITRLGEQLSEWKP